MKISVKNKLTYLWLLLPVFGIIKFCIHDLGILNMFDFLFEVFISAFVSIIGWNFFIKFNTKSQYLNPDFQEDGTAQQKVGTIALAVLIISLVGVVIAYFMI